MVDVIYTVISWWLLCLCSTDVIVTEKYTRRLTSKNDLVAIYDVNTTLLKCSLLCLQHAHSCPGNKELELCMSDFTGSCDETRKCVGFGFTNGACVLFKMATRPLKETKTKRQEQLYITSRLVEPEAHIGKNTIRLPSATIPTISTGTQRVRNAIWGNESSTKPSERTPNTATFGSRCFKNDQCDYDHGLCLSGKCTCRIGHSFDFNSHTCVTRCSHYGAKFSSYPNSGIDRYHCNKRTNTIFTGLKRNCRRQCLKEKTFVCISAEYFTVGLVGQCQLCNKTWTELRESDRVNGTAKRYTLMYRHCA